MTFIGRESELEELNRLYRQNTFQLFVLYGRRRVGKTTLLNEFCKGKDAIFYSAEQSNQKRNLEKFSEQVFQFYGETVLEAFSSWTNALTYMEERQGRKQLVLILDEFPYLVRKNQAILSELQHLIDHKLKNGNLFIVLCGSYMGFMEKEVLGNKSPLFGRRTGQLHLKPFDYRTALRFMDTFSAEEKLMLYGVFGGTPLYLQQIQAACTFEETVRDNFLKVTAYLYEEPLLLLRQEVQEPGIYCAIIEAVACGYTKSNEIATKTGEETAKCLKYMKTLCELGILYKEMPYGEKESSRRTIYGISDLMFCFWYRYVFANRTLIETGAQDAVWKKRVQPDYPNYMGMVFERVCREYLLHCNREGKLPFLFTSIGRWWGTDVEEHTQVEIDLVANDDRNYLFCECKWRRETVDLSTLDRLRKNAAIFGRRSERAWFVLFSKSGFSDRLREEAAGDEQVLLVGLEEILEGAAS